MPDINNIYEQLELLKPKFDISPDEAKSKYDTYKNNDPFPSIKPALLNTADIIDYVASTGMIHPFHPEMATLKPASYAVPLLGKCVYFDDKGEKKVEIIERDRDKVLILKRNSITFVTLEPYFLIPDYIALRFDLKIKNVYRGILLGTGPIVDPGFEGRLSLPLHNLTTNDYKFEAGEDLVYFEFTKLSENESWMKNEEDIYERIGIYVPFPERKKEREDVENYLAYAAPHLPIRSSIPDAIEKAEISAKKALELAKKSQLSAEKSAAEAESTKKLSIIYVLGVIISLVLLIYSGYQIVNQSTSLVRDTRDSIWEVQHNMSLKQKELNIEIENLKYEIKFLKSNYDSLTSNVNITKEDEKNNKSEK